MGILPVIRPLCPLLLASFGFSLFRFILLAYPLRAVFLRGGEGGRVGSLKGVQAKEACRKQTLPGFSGLGQGLGLQGLGF